MAATVAQMTKRELREMLYYQSSLAYLYKLATWQHYDFRGKEIKDWSPEFLKPLSPEDLDTYRAV